MRAVLHHWLFWHKTNEILLTDTFSMNFLIADCSPSLGLYVWAKIFNQKIMHHNLRQSYETVYTSWHLSSGGVLVSKCCERCVDKWKQIALYLRRLRKVSFVVFGETRPTIQAQTKQPIWKHDFSHRLDILQIKESISDEKRKVIMLLIVAALV